MSGLGKALLAGAFFISAIVVIVYFSFSTVFKASIGLPNKIEELHAEIELLKETSKKERDELRGRVEYLEKTCVKAPASK